MRRIDWFRPAWLVFMLLAVYIRIHAGSYCDDGLFPEHRIICGFGFPILHVILIVGVKLALDGIKKDSLWLVPAYWAVTGIFALLLIPSIYRLLHSDWRLFGPVPALILSLVLAAIVSVLILGLAWPLTGISASD